MDEFNDMQERETTEEKSHPKEGKKGKLGYFLSGLFGALVGGLIIALVFGASLNPMFFGEDENTAQTDPKTIIETQSTAPSAVEAVAELVTPSVVGVTTVELTQTHFFENVENTGIGSGVIVTSDGYILTNQHVITDNPKSIQVSLKDGREFDAQKIWADADLDLAVIKIDAENLPAAQLGDSEEVSVGEMAIAIGNPLGLTFERTVTSGIVSALNRSIMIDQFSIAEDLIQTDASINRGNSGGPLLNQQGQVIGINTYKLDTGEGMGFAIPINLAKPIIDQIVTTGEFKPTVMGISILDREIARYFSGEEIQLEEGILIMEVQPDSGAEKAGLQKDDVIVEVEGIKVNTMVKLREILYGKLPGETVEVTYKRNGSEHQTQVELSEWTE